MPDQSRGEMSNFLDHLEDPRTFTISVQLDPASGGATHDLHHLLDTVRSRADVQAVDINSTSSRVAWDAVMTAAAVQTRGLTAIPHLTCRDASLGGIVNQVLAGVTHFGLQTVLAVTGDRPKPDTFPQCGGGVFQGDAITLVAELDRLRRGQHRPGKPEELVRFAIGVAFDYTLTGGALQRERARLAAKREHRANFVMAQPIFTVGQAEQLLDATNGVWDRPVMPGIWPLVHREQAQHLTTSLPGIHIPDEVIRRLPSRAEGMDRCRAVGRQLAHELLEQIRQQRLFPGAYLIAPNRNAWEALKTLDGD